MKKDLLVTILYGEFEKGRQVYKLEECIKYEGWEHAIYIDKGFRTDLVSLPWLLRILAAPTGKWAYAAIFHDFLYRTHYVSRKSADLAFYKIMTEDNVPTWKAKGAYALVYLFGWYRYNKYKNNTHNYRNYGYVENITR